MRKSNYYQKRDPLPFEYRKYTIREHEVDECRLYVATHFNKQRIDQRSSQWNSSKGQKINPNLKGILGEVVFYSHYFGEGFNLTEFLLKRPLKQSDKGDLVIDGQIFDIKTHVMPKWIDKTGRERGCDIGWKYDNDQYFKAMVEARHVEEKPFLAGFIFVVIDQFTRNGWVIGWEAKEDIYLTWEEKEFTSKTLENGDTVPVVGYFNEYRHLKDMAFLVRHDSQVHIIDQDYMKGVRSSE